MSENTEWSCDINKDDIGSLWLVCRNMGQCSCCSLRSVIAVLVAAEIVFLLFTISLSVDRARRQNVFLTTPSPLDVSMIDYDNDTVDEFLTNYSIYCEKFLIPHALNIRHYSREKPLCPCIPDDLGQCFVRAHYI